MTPEDQREFDARMSNPEFAAQVDRLAILNRPDMPRKNRSANG